MKRSILSQLVYSNLLWMSALLLIVAASLADLFLPQAGRVEALVFGGSMPWRIFGLQELTRWALLPVWQRVFASLMILASGLGVQLLATEFRLIRVRTYFPIFLTCLLAVAILPSLTFGGSWIANLILIYSFQRLLVSAERNKSVRAAFDATFLLGIASLFEIRLACLLPVYWLIMMVLQSMNTRSFWSSLLGFAVVVWIISGLSFLTNQLGELQTMWNAFLDFKLPDLQNLGRAEIVFFVSILLLIVASVFNFWSKQHLEKLKTRNFLNSLFLFWLGLVSLWLFSANDSGAMLHILTFSSILMAHFFSLSDTLFTRFLFLLLISVCLAAFYLI